VKLGLAAIVLAVPVAAQQAPDTADLLDALARSAAIFARSVPGLTARESLHQKARRGNMEILKTGKNHEPKSVAFTIPDEFQVHDVVCEYSFGNTPDSTGFHELRKILTIDGAAVPPAPMRHSLTLNSESPEDDAKKALLEDLEHTQLQGSVVDFGPMLLLFTKQRQPDFEFRRASRTVIRYRQLTGAPSVTEFRDRSETKHPLSGEIILRETDLVPTRITVNTEEILTTKFTLFNDVVINYQPTPYGLAPSTVIHRQYLNRDLLVENSFTYTDYRGRTFIP
jgi:hypothetical protein